MYVKFMVLSRSKCLDACTYTKCFLSALKVAPTSFALLGLQLVSGGMQTTLIKTSVYITAETSHESNAIMGGTSACKTGKPASKLTATHYDLPLAMRPCRSAFRLTRTSPPCREERRSENKQFHSEI